MRCPYRWQRFVLLTQHATDGPGARRRRRLIRDRIVVRHVLEVIRGHFQLQM